MKRIILRSLLMMWVLVATAALARFWLTYHYLFPQVPIPFFIWVSDLYGATNGEDMADVELLVALAGALVIVLIVTSTGILVWRKKRRFSLTHR